MVSARQEVSNIRRQHNRHATRVGDTIVYFEQIPFGDNPLQDSTYDHVYDEPALGVGGRKFERGVSLPVLGQVVENEDSRRAIPDGRETVQTIRFSLSYQTMVDSGVKEPWESPRHLSDIVYFDGRYYAINTYKVMGRVQDEISVIIAGNEVFMGQDMVNDPGPELPHADQQPWPTTFPSAATAPKLPAELWVSMNDGSYLMLNDGSFLIVGS